MPKEEAERVAPDVTPDQSGPHHGPRGPVSDSENSVCETTINDSLSTGGKNSSTQPQCITLDTTDDGDITDNDPSVCGEYDTRGKNSSTQPQCITLDTTDDGVITDNKPSVCETNGDRGGGIVEPSSSSLDLEDMITMDTTPDSIPVPVPVLEEDLPLVELKMPEGVCIETEVGDGSRAALDFVPSYNTDLEGVLADKEFSMLTGKPILDNARPRKTCFNCEGDHNLAECAQPFNQARVATNRKKHHGSRTSSIRYHEDCENKYGQYQPGCLSQSLRHALGLRGGQLPIFVYRMRVLGYPPGWLMDAEVHQDSVKMYDGLGKRVQHPEEEDGEVDAHAVKYRPEKLISFPGFNDPLPRGVRDECHQYRLPQMMPYHQRSEFLRFMNQNRAQTYRKKKMKSVGKKSQKSAPSLPPLPALDMDVDAEQEVRAGDIEFNPPLPTEPMPPAPPEDLPPPPPLPAERSHTPEEGEISDHSEEAQTETSVKEQVEKDSGNINDGSQDDSQDSVQDNSKDGETPMKGESTKSKRHHRSHSKGFKLGTFIPESATPFTLLPEADLWTVDVSEHIVFENLPDALGTWNKMKELMGQVKDRMSVIHQDSDDE